MKSNRWFPAVALAAAVGVGAAACGDAQQQGAEMAMADRSSAQTAAVDTNVVFVDVRTDREWEAGHVDGAIHIPLSELPQRYGELERYEDKELVLYCRSGNRSGQAKRLLEQRGFDNVHNGGGLGDLASQGVPTSANCC